MKERTLHSASPEGTEALAASLGAALGPRLAASGGTVFIGLHGELGAGKTAFVRGLVRGVAPERADEVSSPTFAVEQRYATDPEIRHLDLYRLESLADLEAIGYRESYFDPGLVVVEWADRVPEAMPGDAIVVELRFGEADEERELCVRFRGAAEAWAELWP